VCNNGGCVNINCVVNWEPGEKHIPWWQTDRHSKNRAWYGDMSICSVGATHPFGWYCRICLGILSSVIPYKWYVKSEQASVAIIVFLYILLWCLWNWIENKFHHSQLLIKNILYTRQHVSALVGPSSDLTSIMSRALYIILVVPEDGPNRTETCCLE
jgi:hypothetical protein